MACETCRLLAELLESAGVPTDIAKPVSRLAAPAEKKVVRKVKRTASDYSKRYGRNFKRVAGKYKLKSGAWAKNGFKRAQKEAHRLTKKKK